MMVKICGITNLEDAQAAIGGGASALGFNFWPKSPRYVQPDRAAELLERLPAGAWRVGVFVNESAASVRALKERLGLDVVQVHGEAAAPVGIRVWKAVSVSEFDAQATTDAEAFLVDAPAGELHGGTGTTYDWSRVAGAKGKIILAGGLQASNVRAAIEAARPWGVDACSRLESAPGKKDHRKMAAFLQAALEEGGR